MIQDIRVIPLFYNMKVDWNHKPGYWCNEIWKNKEHHAIHLSEKLEELIEEVQESHGYS